MNCYAALAGIALVAAIAACVLWFRKRFARAPQGEIMDSQEEPVSFYDALQDELESASRRRL